MCVRINRGQLGRLATKAGSKMVGRACITARPLCPLPPLPAWPRHAICRTASAARCRASRPGSSGLLRTAVPADMWRCVTGRAAQCSSPWPPAPVGCTLPPLFRPACSPCGHPPMPLRRRRWAGGGATCPTSSAPTTRRAAQRSGRPRTPCARQAGGLVAPGGLRRRRHHALPGVLLRVSYPPRLPQGSAADLAKAAMVAIHARLAAELPPGVARLVLQIHDEFLLEARGALDPFVFAF